MLLYNVMSFLKNVGCGFIFLASTVTLPTLSVALAYLIGHWIAMGTGSVIFGFLGAFFLLLLFLAVSIELTRTLMSNLPFEW